MANPGHPPLDKPPKRIKDKKALEACGAIGRCERCRRTDLPIHRAHLVGRAQRGRSGDTKSNLVALCPKCHIGDEHTKGSLTEEMLRLIVAARDGIEAAKDFGTFECPTCLDTQPILDDGYLLICSACGHLIVRYRDPYYTEAA